MFYPKIAGALQPAESQLLLVGVCRFVTALSLIACVPFVWLLNRYVPWLVGRSRASTTHSHIFDRDVDILSPRLRALWG